MYKRVIIAVAALFLVAAGTLGGIKAYRVYKAHQCGILLAFDDYNADNWEAYFDLFDQYNVRVTFFVSTHEPTDFCYAAIERGHEIAYHTADHVRMTEATEDQVYAQAIAPIEVFREQGIELTTFAYPYGSYSEQLNEELLQYYDVLRGAWYYQLAGKNELRHGFVESLPIDNIYYETDEAFWARIDSVLNELDQNVGAVAGMYSHAIEGGDWCVTPERLEYIFQRAQEMGIQFYTYKELQQN